MGLFCEGFRFHLSIDATSNKSVLKQRIFDSNNTQILYKVLKHLIRRLTQSRIMSVTTFTLGAVVALFIFRYCIPYNVVMFFVDLVPKHVQSWTLTMIMPKFSFPQYEHSKPPLILQTASNLVRRWLAHPDVQSHFVHCFRREYSEAPPNAEERRIILTILLKELPRILVLQPNAMNAYAFHIRRPLSDANAIAINKEV